MPLTSIHDELSKAQEGHYAVPLFDTVEMLAVNGIVKALEERSAPGIVAMGGRSVLRPTACEFAEYIRGLARSAEVPISLMLDHGPDFESCMKALRLGFTDIMYDGSQLPLEENIANTREIVRIAHAMGVGVEGEVGHVGQGSEYESYGAEREGFSDPALVEQFAAETDVDYLAVAVGTAHGLYQGEPVLDLDLLREIRRRVDIPLVMHGGSGLLDEQYKASISADIAKINIFTSVSVLTGERMIEAANTAGASYPSIVRVISDAFREGCGRFLDVFGTSGKAGA